MSSRARVSGEIVDAIGGALCAMDLPPEPERRRFTVELARRLAPHAPMTEDVSVRLQPARPRDDAVTSGA